MKRQFTSPRPSGAKKTVPARAYKYQMIFAPYTRMRKRLDAIVAGEPDPFPGSCGCEDVELFMKALAKGEDPPHAMVNDDGGKRRVPRRAKDYHIVERVADALLELF